MDNTNAHTNAAQTQRGHAQTGTPVPCGTLPPCPRRPTSFRGYVLPRLAALCRATCLTGLAVLCLGIMLLAAQPLAVAAATRATPDHSTAAHIAPAATGSAASAAQTGAGDTLPPQSGLPNQPGLPNKPELPEQSEQFSQPRQSDLSKNGLIHVTASRPFQTPVSKDMARLAGLSALRIKALEQAEIILAQQDTVRVILADEFADRTLAAELTTLAALNLHPASQPAEALSGLPPVLQLELSASYSLTPDSGLPQAAQDLLKNPLLVENGALAAQMERQYLAAYDEAAATAMQDPTPENRAHLDKACAALRGIIEYFDILPGLRLPQKMSPAMLPSLQRAAALLPDNYLLNAELGRLYLWLEDSENSMLCLNASIAQNPDFAQAYSHRGTLWLVRHKPSLALADFNRAIVLAPNRAEYYYNRAVAWKTMGNTPAMCADLRQSCLNGHCDALEWAHANNECQ
ncbi:tetratricopeptide repeat protein [Desulfovibrio sp. OttesenSCG-928-C06]|nr:tetratricopeptide repeat protein [Desulfovibrio sp. OttesenSCG-928-C06]